MEAISPEWLTSRLGFEVKRFVWEGALVRGRHSASQRGVAWLPKRRRRRRDSHEEDEEEEEVLALFFKSMVPVDLPERPASKWVASIRSYKAESAAFMHLHACGVQMNLPKTYYVLSESASSPHEGEEDFADFQRRTCRFMIVSEDLAAQQEWLQESALGTAAAKAVLSALARLHGSSWGKKAVHAQLIQAGLHDQGAFWALSNRGADEVARLEESFNRFLECFQVELSGLDMAAARGAACRLRDLAPSLDQAARGMSGARCIVHGDCKASNLFIKDESEVIFVDLQWTGLGTAASDVAYFIATSLQEGALSSELDLLRYYHYQLTHALASHNASICYSFEEFKMHYEMSFLDYSRCVLGYLWRGLTPERLAVNASKERTGQSMIMRSLAHIRWVICRTVALIPRAEEVLSQLSC